MENDVSEKTILPVVVMVNDLAEHGDEQDAGIWMGLWRSSCWCHCFEFRLKLLIIIWGLVFAIVGPMIVCMSFLTNLYDAAALGFTFDLMFYPAILFSYSVHQRHYYVPTESYFSAAKRNIYRILYPYSLIFVTIIVSAILIKFNHSVFAFNSIWILIVYAAEIGLTILFAILYYNNIFDQCPTPCFNTSVYRSFPNQQPPHQQQQH